MQSTDNCRISNQLFFILSIILGWNFPAFATDNVVHLSFASAKACNGRLARSAVRQLSEAEREEAFGEILERVRATPTLHAIVTLSADFRLREWRSGGPNGLRLKFEYEAGGAYVVWVEASNFLVSYVIRDPQRRFQLKELILRRFSQNHMALLYPGDRRQTRPHLMDAYVL